MHGGSNKVTSSNSDGRGKIQQQSTKISGGNIDGNSNDDSNVNDNENEGNGIIDGSAASAMAAGRRRQK